MPSPNNIITQAKSIDYWNNQERLESFAALQLLRGHLMICIGAGISMFAGLPSWTSLLKEISESLGIDPSRMDRLLLEESPYRVASILLHDGYKGNRSQFDSDLKEVLYKDSSVTTSDQAFDNPGMQALSFLCASSIRGGSNSIVTFNYDDLVERVFKHSGTICRSINSPYFLNARTDVDVFHPHGFLPENANTGLRSVICEEDLETSEMEHWRGILYRLFSTHFPLFVGLSGHDELLLSYISNSPERNPLIQEYDLPFMGVALGVGNVNIAGFESSKIKVQMFNDPAQWPKFVANICRKAAEMIIS